VKREIEGSMAYCESAVLSTNSGGAAVSDLGSLVADLLGFWDGRVRNGGGLYRHVGERKSERNHED
jgi:hypothetical protein